MQTAIYEYISRQIKSENPESSGAGGTGKENPAANTPGLPRQTPLPNIGVGGSRVGDGKGQR